MQVEPTARPLPPKSPPSITDRKNNDVFYSIKESPEDTSRYDLLKHDLDDIFTIVSGIDTTLTSASIKDFYRLGKYKQTSTHPRPILVKFLRTFEASLVLSNKGSLSSSAISIKPDMTQVEQETEQVLLKERRHLVDSGIEHRFIRINGNSLHVKRKLHGSVQNSQFRPAASSDTVEPMSAMSVDSNSTSLTDLAPSSNSSIHADQPIILASSK